jgi:hypothetical protein
VGRDLKFVAIGHLLPFPVASEISSERPFAPACEVTMAVNARWRHLSVQLSAVRAQREPEEKQADSC